MFIANLFLWSPQNNIFYKTSHNQQACQSPTDIFILGCAIGKQVGNICDRGAESESEPESEAPGVVATSQESESESTKLPRIRLRNVFLESVI